MEELDPGWLSGVIERASVHLSQLPETSKPAWIRSMPSPEPSRHAAAEPEPSDA